MNSPPSKTQWCIRKWILRIRQRIMDKRIVGAVDLYTMDPIPPESMVAVYDPRSKSKYLFHTNTISRAILSALTYSSFGIAYPKAPMNPYTNIPWSIGQVICIVGQIIHNLNRNHCSIPHYIYLFRKEKYDITQFSIVNKARLQMDATVSFFKKEDDAYRNLIYTEIIEDLYTENSDMLMSGWRSVRSLVLLQNLPPRLKALWDTLVLSAWMWQNHGIAPLLIDDLDLEFLTVHGETMAWWREQTQTPAPIQTQTAAPPPPLPAPPPPPPPTPVTTPTASARTSPAASNHISLAASARTSPAAPSRYILSNTVLPVLSTPRRSTVSTTPFTQAAINMLGIGRPPRLPTPAPPPVPQQRIPTSPMLVAATPVTTYDILDATVAQITSWNGNAINPQ